MIESDWNKCLIDIVELDRLQPVLYGNGMEQILPVASCKSSIRMEPPFWSCKIGRRLEEGIT
jgi:hypothetical protein